MKLKVCLLIFFVVIIAYSNSLGGEFIYDDDYVVLRNLSIRNLENFPYFFSNHSTVAFSGLSEEIYRPLTTLSFALNYFFGKVNPFGYHLVNMLFHAFNAILLFLFLSALFENFSVALFASLFFACHPVQTEAVTWISGRGNVLFLFFYLSSLIFYMKFIKGEKKIYFIYSILACAMSLFSKEMAITLPLMIVACDIHFFNGGKLKNKIYRYLPYFAITIFYLLVRLSVLGKVSQCGWWGGSPYYTFLTMSRVLIDYIKLLIIPARLCAFYAVNISYTIAETPVMISLALLALLAIAMPFIFRRSRLGSFAICWFFITILPVSNIIPLKALMAERYLYMPSIGFCICLALCVAKIGTININGIIDNGKALASLVAACIVIAYSAKTIARNEDWKNAATLTRSIIAVSPMNPWAYNALGSVYLSEGKSQKAIGPIMKSIALSRDFAAARSSLGFAYTELGRFDDAVKMFRQALAIKPDGLETLNSLGVTYGRMKRYADAVGEFEQSIKLDPAYVSAYLNLGATYERMGKNDMAIEQYSMIPNRTNSVQDIAISYIRIGDVYRRIKEDNKSKEYYNKALGLCGRGMEELRKVVQDRLKGHLPEMR